MPLRVAFLRLFYLPDMSSLFGVMKEKERERGKEREGERERERGGKRESSLIG